MGMDQTQSLESGGRRSVSFERWDKYLLSVAYNYVFNDTLPIDQDADLTVNFPGQLRQIAGKFMGNDLVRRRSPSIDLLDTPNLLRPESTQVTGDFVNNVLLFSDFPLENQEYQRGQRVARTTMND